MKTSLRRSWEELKRTPPCQASLTVRLRTTSMLCSTSETSSTSFPLATRTPPPLPSATTPGTQPQNSSNRLANHRTAHGIWDFPRCLISSLSSSSDRLVPGLDTIVPFETTKAYDMLDIIQGVRHTHTACCLLICGFNFRLWTRGSSLRSCLTTLKTS